MDVTKLSENLLKYADNYDEQIRIETGLFEHMGKREWQEAYCRRAEALANLYAENEEILKAVSEIGEEPLDEETADMLYQTMETLVERSCFDACLAVPVLERLLAFYETSSDKTRAGKICNYLSINISNTSSGNEYLSLEFMHYIDKIREIDEKGGTASFQDEEMRRCLWIGYTYLFSDECYKYFGTLKMYAYLQEMLTLWNSREMQNVAQNDKKSKELIDLIQKGWAFNMIEIIDDSSDEVREFFIRLAEELFGQETKKGEICQYDYNIYAVYLKALLLQEKISYDEGIRRLYQYYQERIHRFEEEEGTRGADTQVLSYGELTYEELSFLMYTPGTLIEWSKKFCDRPLPDDVLETILEATDTIIYKRLAKTPGTERTITTCLCEYCINLLPFLRSREEKEQWLLNLIVRRQLPTYIHCRMVQRMASTVFEAISADRPEMFADAIAEVGAAELPEFIEKCAIFHDIGKAKIANVINIQTRAISDDEFNVIRTHPDAGYRSIFNDPDFARYKDVVLGHHKFYNGQGGYPKNFDNTKSPYRSVIDLITICDCLDAATDVLGRNYKRAKTFDEVLEEFERDKGVRYNPDIVDYILGSEDLRQELSHIISSERLETAYQIYSEFIS